MERAPCRAGALDLGVVSLPSSALEIASVRGKSVLYKREDRRSELHTYVNADRGKGLSVILAEREMVDTGILRVKRATQSNQISELWVQVRDSGR